VVATTGLPRPIAYLLHARFRCGAQGRIRTRQGVALDTRLNADVWRFIQRLKTDGWLFPEGRAMLIELLGVGADDGVTMTLSRDKH